MIRLISSRERLYSFPTNFQMTLLVFLTKKYTYALNIFRFCTFTKKFNYTNSTKFILFFVLVSPLLMVRPLCPNLSTPLSTCRPTSLLIDSKCNWVLLVVRSRGCFSRLLQKLQTWNTWVPSCLGWWSWLQEFSFRFRSSEVNDFLKKIMFHNHTLKSHWFLIKRYC